MRRIFLDVGSHFGESIELALDPRFGFDRVVAFEPVQMCVEHLKTYKDPRLVLQAFGLGSRDEAVKIYEPGSLGASRYVNDETETGQAEHVELRDVAGWFTEHLDPTDDIWMKLNCEGGEADIIERLSQSGQLQWVSRVLLSLDIERYPDEAHRAAETISLLESSAVEYTRREDIGYSVRAWLTPLGSTPPLVGRVRYWSGAHLPVSRRVRAHGAVAARDFSLRHPRRAVRPASASVTIFVASVDKALSASVT